MCVCVCRDILGHTDHRDLKRAYKRDIGHSHSLSLKNFGNMSKLANWDFWEFCEKKTESSFNLRKEKNWFN